MARALQDPRLRPVNSGAGRVPPHDLDAEESLLGAMLLSRDAIAAALECCSSADFYKPAHGHIFGAVTALYTRGEPADPVTVADELRRSGLLESVGDPSVLISLQVNTPSTANASHYARIVEEHALLRGLVTVAGEIAELGYSVPEDVTEVIDRAESMVFEVAQRRVVDTMSSLRDLLAQSLDHLEHLYARGDTITGVPTGYTDLDERLAGLQKSNLVVVGARPAMGKALALDTPVPTPAGWTTMGELEVGAEVFDEEGRRSGVTYCSPLFVGHRCYRVAFDDGTEIVADAGHRWLAYDLPAWQARRAAAAAASTADGPGPGTPSPRSWQGQPRVVTTEEMVAAGVRTGAGRPNWYLPVAEPLTGPEAELPVEPYRLGRHLAEAVLADQPARLPDRYLRAAFKARLDTLAGFLDTFAPADLGAVRRDGARTELWLADRFVMVQLRELLCTLGLAPSALERRSVRSAGRARATQWVVRWSSTDGSQSPGVPGRAAVAGALARYGRHRRHAVVAVEEVPSVPVRCIAVDSPSRLFLAGPSMVPTHNTSFALGIVANAAVHGRVPVLLFSLEMSHLELTQRLLCSEARVDATRMRNGRLLESDWPKISDAIGRLGDAPIYIDDNPNVTVMDIRAKARRLKAREGLGLVVVDYLQLMSGHQRSRAENRQVEVSEISRGLKVLARELDIPVVALSQLSRNLEMRQDKRPVLADLRESGCLTADTRIMRSDNGAEVTMGELLESGERDIPVWSIDEHLRVVPATMTHVFASGVKRTYELRLASGRRVRGSGNHPFRTPEGWRRLDALVAGDWLAVVDECAPGDESGAKVLWDDFVAIEDRGEQAVFDATVLGHHNFIANGIVAHNSIEQDSDVVMFIYRDEIYNPDSSDRGTAEIIIAKHRNGPTGVTQLAFMDHHTRFANMARV
ncbi:MAG: replicative DNA helicase [Acidobacteriota bacterium]|nr:replicative DNA helicase [Acidobacteriota bacterium]